MSLINDALKRAKQAQQEAAPSSSPSNLELRPLEHGQYTRNGVSMAIPALLAIASLVLLVLLWQTARNAGPAGTIEANARTRNDSAPPMPSHPALPATVATPASTPAPAAPASPLPATPVAVSQPAPPASSNTPTLFVVSGPEPTNVGVPAVVPPPKPALPRLQAIVYHPTRPSVMINGKTLFVGDKMGEFRVRAIDQESVTLVSAGQTNVLTLPE